MALLMPGEELSAIAFPPFIMKGGKRFKQNVRNERWERKQIDNSPKRQRVKTLVPLALFEVALS
jgi:hypothetical protein